MEICLEKAIHPSWLWTHSLYKCYLSLYLLDAAFAYLGWVPLGRSHSQIRFSFTNRVFMHVSCSYLLTAYLNSISIFSAFLHLSTVTPSDGHVHSFLGSSSLVHLPPTTRPVSPSFKNGLSELDETSSVISPLILWSLTKEQQGEFGETNETW